MNLRIYPIILGVVADLVRLARHRVARRDKNMADQLSRAAQSIVLNFVEGIDAPGKNRNARLSTALCSGREAMAAVHLSIALGDVSQAEVDDVLTRLDRVNGTLWRLMHTKR